jgi:hypothetical protein
MKNNDIQNDIISKIDKINNEMEKVMTTLNNHSIKIDKIIEKNVKIDRIYFLTDYILFIVCYILTGNFIRGFILHLIITIIILNSY